jgi:hypothetical protein
MDFTTGIVSFVSGWLSSSALWAYWYMTEQNRQIEKKEALRRQASKYKALYELRKMEQES